MTAKMVVDAEAMLAYLDSYPPIKNLDDQYSQIRGTQLGGTIITVHGIRRWVNQNARPEAAQQGDTQ